MKIIVFDKFLGYQTGGAQSSLHFLLKELIKDSNHEWKFLGCNVQKSFSADKYKLNDWQVERIDIKEFPRFPYFEYWINRKKIKKFIEKQEADLLITQGKLGEVAGQYFKKQSIYFIRDEYHFNQIPIFRKGFKKFLKKIYIFSQFIFLKSLFKDNTKAMEKSLVIANSIYMARHLDKLFNIKSEFVYPFMDIESFIDNEVSLDENEFIISLGSEIIKGGDIVEKIAKAMPNHKFMIVGRNYTNPTWRENILYQPWTKNPLEIYKKAKIFLIANIIHPAIPRVGRIGAEAMALGIPAIGSKIGEVRDYLPDKLYISDRENIDLWKEKILDILANYDKYRRGLKEQALQFDKSVQIEKFKEIVKRRLNIEI